MIALARDPLEGFGDSLSDGFRIALRNDLTNYLVLAASILIERVTTIGLLERLTSKKYPEMRERLMEEGQRLAKIRAELKSVDGLKTGSERLEREIAVHNGVIKADVEFLSVWAEFLSESLDLPTVKLIDTADLGTTVSGTISSRRRLKAFFCRLCGCELSGEFCSLCGTKND
jgi:hypothetical protein